MNNAGVAVGSLGRKSSGNNRKIIPLEPTAIAQIHSSRHITSLQGVVLSLLENSLDAGATKVEIAVDWKRGGCTVNDNGVGIPINEFARTGRLGWMYCTSKRAQSKLATVTAYEAHGWKGTFLAELSAVSLLSISSASAGSTDTASLTLHHGKVLARSLSLTNGAAPTHFCTGTDVRVRDLFGNMPVRVRQRAQNVLLNNETQRSLNQLKHGIVGLLLAWPISCAVKLSEQESGAITMNLSGTKPVIQCELTKRTLSQLEGAVARYDPRDVLPLLFQSGLASPETRPRWIPLSASSAVASLKGLICLDPAPLRHCQFVALGVHPCHAFLEHHELYEVIERVFARSCFGVLEQPQRNRHSIQAAAGRKRAKGIDRHPMFCLGLKLVNKSPSTEVANLGDATLKAILDLLQTTITAWLESNHFRPRKRKRGRKDQMSCSEAIDVPDEDSQRIRSTESRSRKSFDPSTTSSAKSFQGYSISKYRKSAIEDLSRIRKGSWKSGTQSSPIASGDEAAYRDDHDRSPHGSFTKTKKCTGMDVLPRVPGAKDVGQIDPTVPPDYSLKEVTTPCLKIQTSCSTAMTGATKIQTAPTNDTLCSVDEGGMLAGVENVEAGLVVSTRNPDDSRFIVTDRTIPWADPQTEQIYRINTRTGTAHPETVSDKKRSLSVDWMALDAVPSSDKRSIRLNQRATLAARSPSAPSALESPKSWLSAFLTKWNNPVFTLKAEHPIPDLSVDGTALWAMHGNERCCTNQTTNQGLMSSETIAGLSKTALQNVEVIGQVDKKFILCKMSASCLSELERRDEVLVLADQHAISERIILEGLFKDLCIGDPPTVPTTCLASQTSRGRPLVFEITTMENELFVCYKSHFAAWGIKYNLKSTSSPLHQRQHIVQLTLTHLPTLIAQRAANLPSLAIDLLRAEIYALVDGSTRPLPSAPFLPSVDWVALLPLMPTGFRDMLHSRACRSAVMFNDTLQLAECEELMRNVARCVFPFVCAHGRVGMVPVVGIGGPAGTQAPDLLGHEDATQEALDLEKPCDASALNSWMAKREERPNNVSEP